MRKDFQKLLCECYKEGRGWATSSGSVRRRLKRLQDDEDTCTSTHIAASKIRTRDKSFGENLAPLKRFIEKQIGRPWNKVYSEICQHNSKAGAVGLHIFQHLFFYIETDTIKDERGRIFTKAGEQGSWWRKSAELIFGALYVDPDDNIIKRYRRNKAQAKAKEPTRFIRVNAHITLEQEHGIWYAYTWTETPRHSQVRQTKHGPRVFYTKVYCHKKNQEVSYPENSHYARSKHQLNKRELKKHKLNNQQ